MPRPPLHRNLLAESGFPGDTTCDGQVIQLYVRRWYPQRLEAVGRICQLCAAMQIDADAVKAREPLRGGTRQKRPPRPGPAPELLDSDWLDESTSSE